MNLADNAEGRGALQINEVLRPGVGLRYELTSRDGDHLGFVARRDGYVEVVRYGEDDPDECEPLFRLTADEAEAVAEIFGAARIAERSPTSAAPYPDWTPGQIGVGSCSPCAGRRLGVTRARTRTWASIVAIVRG